VGDSLPGSRGGEWAVVLGRGAPRHAGLAATAGAGGTGLVGPGAPTDTHPRGPGSPCGPPRGGGGRVVASRAMVGSDPYRREPGTQGGRWCCPARHRCLRGLGPGSQVWLGRRRNARTGARQTSRSHAPAVSAWLPLGRLSRLRGPIATGFADGTPSLGMGDDEVRRGRGGPPHLTRCLLAHVVLVRLRLG
jgi:hypothetical protein